MTEKTTPQPTTPPAKTSFMPRYVMGWAVLASISLMYLVTLAVQPDFVARLLASQGSANVIDEREQALTQAVAEIQAIRDTVSQFREELIALRSEVSAQSDRDRDILERIAALETPPAPVAAAKAPAQKAAAAKPAPAPAEKKKAAAPAIETGSVAAPAAAAAVTFGEAVVVPAAGAAGPAVVTATVPPAASKTYGVQIATGPSVDSLRLSWTLLAERHGSALASLQPRYTMGADEQGVAYNLVAGPVKSPAEAQQLCAELATRATPCAPTTFRGDAL